MQPDELTGEHTILLNVGHCFRDQVLDACPELNRADAHVTRTNSLETVRNMVASGLGISVLPRDALTPKYHSRLVVPVPFTQPAPSRRVALAYRRSFPRPRHRAIRAVPHAAPRSRPIRAAVAAEVTGMAVGTASILTTAFRPQRDDAVAPLQPAAIPWSSWSAP